MQPITRVHHIFRIRTIVNATSELNKKKKSPRDKEIGQVLVSSGLSKYREEKAKDRIMRRARDHLTTASYLGLLTRKGRPFGYSSTTVGKLLQRYKPEEECPKDSLEEAVFIDKILRFKLTNVYDLQRKRKYEKLRSRPCLYILDILSRKSWLHEHQLALATGAAKCDPVLQDALTQSLASKIISYNIEKDLQKFYSDFKIKSKDKKNMTRNIRPVIDWCQSVGLITSKEIEDVGPLYNLTDRGKLMLGKYKKKTPIWFTDLGKIPSVKAALLIFYQYAITEGFVFEGILGSFLEIGLITKRISEVVVEIEEQSRINLVNIGTAKDTMLDFSFEYDVPPEKRREVMHYLNVICNIASVRSAKVLQVVETSEIEDLERVLDSEHQSIRKILTGRFSEKTAISEDPVLSKIATLIPSVGVLGQYRSDFEKEVVLFLRFMGFNAIKYQGQLADRVTKTYLVRFFENNPDIFIVNGIESLVECKSIGEWKSPLTYKSVQKEFAIYKQNFPEVHSDSVVIAYEGTLDAISQQLIASILEDSKSIVFVTKNFLINCIHQLALKERLVKTIKNPQSYPADQRILFS